MCYTHAPIKRQCNLAGFIVLCTRCTTSTARPVYLSAAVLLCKGLDLMVLSNLHTKIVQYILSKERIIYPGSTF